MKHEIIALSDGTFAVFITYPVTCLPLIPHSSPTCRLATGTLADSVPLRPYFLNIEWRQSGATANKYSFRCLASDVL